MPFENGSRKTSAANLDHFQLAPLNSHGEEFQTLSHEPGLFPGEASVEMEASSRYIDVEVGAQIVAILKNIGCAATGEE